MTPKAKGRRIVAYANRLPITKSRDGWRPADGGLVTALRPALQARGGAWVGWDGGAGDVPSRVEGLDISLHPVSLNRKEVHDYYQGFSNRSLWPLLHDLIQQPVFDRKWWEVYRDVNQRFASVPIESAGSKRPLLWVHDYHLMLLPEMLRKTHRRNPIAFFLHTPFPAPEIFMRLPWREQILRGLLGADLVAFHTDPFRDNFLRTCAACLDDVKVEGTVVTMPDGMKVHARTDPISIDADDFATRALDPRVDRELARLSEPYVGRTVMLGVDRLDYTKGILERLKALELLMHRRHDLLGKIVLIQVAVPSRGEVSEYKDLRSEVERQVGRINGTFTEPGRDVPIHYLHRNLPQHRMLAYYRLADVMLVTPLKDGMNLVAKEFVVSQAAAGRGGALVLSEFAGAAEELHEAILCNPFDVDGLSNQIERSLEMDAQERSHRIKKMAARVHHRSVYSWIEDVIEGVEAIRS